MIKNLFTISAIIGANLIKAQTVGDASLGTYNFNNNQLLNTGAISHYAPMVFVEDGESTVVWAGSTSPNTGIYHTKLNSSTYISVGTVDTVVAYTGVLNSDGDGLSHQADFESTTNKFLDIYRFADNLGPVFKDFSLIT